MTHGNGHDRSWRSRYDKPNKYAGERKQTDTNRLPAVTAPTVARPPIDQFQPRNLPTPAVYTPVLGESRRGRRRAKQLVEDLRTASEVHEAARGCEESLTNLEEAHQQRELVQLRRAQLPARIELENLSIGKEVLAARTAFESMVEQQQDDRTDRERHRLLDHEDFETQLANRRAARLEAEARARAAEEYAGHAAEISQRRAEADLHKATEAAFGKEADAEAERRRRDQERQRRRQTVQPEGPDMPEPLARHYATERKVQTSRKRAEEMAEAIRQRAAAAGRELTDDEAEDIDALFSAAAGAEGTIRRGDATDFEV
jgi:hypothetical protein